MQYDAPQHAPHFHFRRAAVTDIPSILQLETLAFASPRERFRFEKIRALVRSRRAIVTVADMGGRLGGWSAGIIGPDKPQAWGRVFALAVHPDERRRKLGSALLHRLMLDLFQQRRSRIFLEVRSDNASAIALYQRFGFARCQHLNNYYGPGVDAYRMMATQDAAKNPMGKC